MQPGCAGNADMYSSGSEAGAHSQDLSPLTLGHSMAQITPGGLRLYDAKGTCSMVPLEELKQIMSKLSFSRYTDLVLVCTQCSSALAGLDYMLCQGNTHSMVCCIGTQTFSHCTFQQLRCCNSAGPMLPCGAASREHYGQRNTMTHPQLFTSQHHILSSCPRIALQGADPSRAAV